MTYKIQYIDDNFQGIINVNGHLVKIPFANIGDEVECIEEKDAITNKITVKYKTKTTQNNINNICNYYTKCGGCLGQHFSQEQYLNLKRNKLINALKQYNITYDNNIEIISYVNNYNQYRRRAVFSVLDNKIGFNEYKSNKVVNISSCPLLTNNINLALDELNKFLKQTKNSLKINQIIINDINNYLDILIYCGSKVDLNIINALQNLFALSCVAKVSYSYKNALPVLLIKKQDIKLQYGNTLVPFTSGGFLQASLQAETTLQNLIVQSVINKFGNLKNVKILDLFGGFGGYTFNLATLDFVKSINIYDFNEEAITTINSLNVAKVKAIMHNLIKYPLDTKILNNFNCVITNPPRSGGGEQIQEIVKSNTINQVIGVYCSIPAFLNDVPKLINAGFSINKLKIIDQFVFNPHIEIFIDLHK